MESEILINKHVENIEGFEVHTGKSLNFHRKPNKGITYIYYYQGIKVYKKTIKYYHDINEEILKGIPYAKAQLITINDILNNSELLKLTSIDTLLKLVHKHKLKIKIERCITDTDFWGHTFGWKINGVLGNRKSLIIKFIQETFNTNKL